jgi:signal transduction histidine kinase
VLAGVCWYIGAILPSMVALHRGALVHLIATYPSGRARHLSTRLVIVLGWLLAIAAGVLGGPWPTLTVATLLGGIVTARATQAAACGRHVLRPEVVGGLSLAAVLVVAGANLLGDLDADLPVALAYDVVVALVVAAVGADLLRAPMTDDTVAEVLTGLGTTPGGDPGLQSQLRRILRDPGLTIGYWSPERGAYVDEHGREVEPAKHATSTSVSEDGQPEAVMFHDPALTDDPGLLEGAAAAVRLTVANAAMRREALDRVARLAEARRRIVEAADVEAEALAGRLERGPRSRLREVSRALADLDTDRCAESATAAAVQQELAAAHRELQELAHGARPRSLTEGGLALALPPLTAGVPTVTKVTVEVGRLDAAVEAGLYFFCAEGLTNVTKHASASEVRMTVRAEPGAVVAEVVDDGIGGADPEGSGLRGLRDRIAALGGTLEVKSDNARGGVRLTARVPTAGGIER